ncbi:MAG TPA: type II secretion system F family protein [Pseudolabrys sp.]|uniref:type II secretion system F family protein n=1 Tax=Pseudolabrys sp. TaxID=1960880 RepID=UPI002DDCF01C|nr:type II secretion system F family protein [Pseudolabrys sp.]HEV2627134.1 type II secretion system F family protein [Pseudolabrys sp.]
MNMLAVAFLAAVAVGGIAYVFLYPLISGERQAEKRRESVARAEPAVRATRGQQRSRRDMVEASLKELEEKTKQQKPSLTVRIAQAGLTWSKRQFILISAAIGFALFIVALTIGPGLVPAIAIGFAGAFGVPRWLLSYLKKRREVKFLDNFPDAVDIIVRGVKAGLPLLDCMKMVATEAPEPIKTEFRVIVDTQAIGMPLGEACNKLYERTPLPEANFFAIVVSIQQKAGGNLSEALGNLSRVLRDRKKMKAKIRAMSQEAKASAGIIGSLPIAVMILVSLTSKDYITLLFTEPLGHLMLAGSAFWMMCGVLVMRKMINFDF